MRRSRKSFQEITFFVGVGDTCTYDTYINICYIFVYIINKIHVLFNFYRCEKEPFIDQEKTVFDTTRTL